MRRKPATILISLEDVSFIFNDRMSEFYFLTARCHCTHCRNDYNSVIVAYTVYLNHLFDLELRGVCLECGNQLGRYIETGGDMKTEANAKAVWQTAHTLKELKIKTRKP